MFSQNAMTAYRSMFPVLKPTELVLSSLLEDRATLDKFIERAKKKGCAPFEHARLGEIVTKYELGLLPPPGPGNWVLLTSEWKQGIFTLDFGLTPPPPPPPAKIELKMINFSRETSQPFGLNHHFLMEAVR